MTKADVLDAFETLEVCTSYKIDGKQSKEIPFQMTNTAIEPQYQSFKGWNKDSSAIKDAADLPAEMKEYISFINSSLNTEVRYISNGPGRDQLVKI